MSPINITNFLLTMWAFILTPLGDCTVYTAQVSGALFKQLPRVN